MSHLCTVAVLPTLHNLHCRPEYAHFNYAVLRQTVVNFAPDGLLGEIRPEDWAATQGGELRPCGPIEYRECLLPLCREAGIPFHPVDFYDDEMLAIAEADRANPANDPVEAELTALMLKLLRRSDMGVGAALDPLILDVIRAKHQNNQRYAPRVAGPTWDPRNLRMLANIATVASRHIGGRLLVTVGLEHLPPFLDHLSLLPMVQLVSPLQPA